MITQALHIARNMEESRTKILKILEMESESIRKDYRLMGVYELYEAILDYMIKNRISTVSSDELKEIVKKIK